MNTNPRHHFHHHQQPQQHHNNHGNTNVQGYSTTANQSSSNQMDKRSSCSRGGLNNNSIPSSSDISASSSSSSSSYGASNPTSFPQQQHQFYSETAEVCYTPSSSTTPVNVKVNPSSSQQNPNFSINSSNSIQFYSNENRTTNSDNSCYFQQVTNFDCDHQSNMIKNSTAVCDTNNSNSVVVAGGGGNLAQNPTSNNNSNSSNFQHNFYPSHSSYPIQPNHTQLPSHEYHHNSNLNTVASLSTASVSPTTVEGDYSRFHGFNTPSPSNNNSSHQHHHGNQLPHHHHQQQEDSSSSLSSCQESSGYFDVIGNRHHVHRHHASQQQQQQQQNHLPYGHCQNSSNQIPFRRNSIESFSTEPGDLPYNAKYGCNNFNNIPFGSGDVIKRESTMHATSTWPPTNSNNNSSNNNTLHLQQQQHHNHQQQQHGHHQNYFFNTNNNSNHRHSNNNDDSDVNFQNPHSQHQFQNFKSCSFDTSHSQMEMEEFKVDQLQLGGSLKSGSTGSILPACGGGVKHRSLSCSMMTSPYQFSVTSDDSGHFNFLDGIENHSSNSSNSNSNSANVDSRNINVPADSVTVNQKYNNSDNKKPNDSHHHRHGSSCSRINHNNSSNSSNSPSTSSSSSRSVVISDASQQQQHVHLQDSKSTSDGEDFLAVVQEEQEQNSVVCESTDCCNSSSAATSSSMSITLKQEKEENDSVEPNSFEDEINSNIHDHDDVSEKDIDSLIISTTTTTLGDCGDGSVNVVHAGAAADEMENKSSRSPPPSIDDDDGCSNLLLEALDEADVSNSSCSLGLFANNSNSDSNQSLNHLTITGTTMDDYNDNESCHSGVSSLSRNNNTLGDICLDSEFSRHRSSSSSHHHRHHQQEQEQQQDHQQVGSSTPLNKHSVSPQKISKRSFSEGDKDLVINTTAVSFINTILIPTGWKREISISSTHSLDNNFVVYYTSPSGTKLRTWDELKNYICSDGTCKCGLSCPLRLEQSFSFDPKVTNSCQEEEEEGLLEENETTGLETPLRLLCNHKRKIPKSEDSPLISSSTNDDIGDCGDHGGGSSKKKRRISGDISSGSKVFVSKGSPPMSTSGGVVVSVPFSQQSPDTTTQTPQTDMSPASSVSSEQSVFCGSRSTNSTPTPMPPTTTSPPHHPVNSSGKNVGNMKGTTAKGNKENNNSNNSNNNHTNNFGFPWPQIPTSSSSPTSQSQTTISPSSVLAPATSPTTTTMTFWPSPNQTISTTSSSSSSSQHSTTNSGSVGTTSSSSNHSSSNSGGNSTKKPGYQHHLTSKGVSVTAKKRANSPCPNIDVRQIPIEQNRPPPRQLNQIQIIPTSAPSQAPTIRSDSISFFPISTTTPPVENQLLNMNTGYSISPVIPNSSGSNSSGGVVNSTCSIATIQQNLMGNTQQFTPQQSLQGTTASLTQNNVNILSLPIQFQRLASSPVVSSCSSASTTNTLIHQSLPSSITISMVGGNTNSSNRNVQIANSSSSSSSSTIDTIITTTQVPSTVVNNVTTATCTAGASSDKSPLQMVQDVVDRFQSSSSSTTTTTTTTNSDGCKADGSLSEIASSSSSTSQNTTPSTGEKDTTTTASNNNNQAETAKLSSSSSSTPTNQIVVVQDISQQVGDGSSAKPIIIIEPPPPQQQQQQLQQPQIATTGESSQISVSTHQSQITVVNLPLPLASTVTTSSAGQPSGLTSVTTTHNVNVQPIVTSSPILNCATSANVVSMNPANNTITSPQQIILQQPQQQDIQSTPFLTTTAGGTSSIRYPVFQTIQPIFLNSNGTPGGQLIISPQPSAGHPGEQQSFIYEQQPQHQADSIQPILQQTTMVLDPSVCGIGSKKKKKRLSKKQQQQQAQFHLQQQLLLQQLAHQQAQVQQVQQQQQTFPLTIFPQSFNLGPQGFSLQPMNMNMNMNFFPTSTILTLPNLILNPADGTLFLQPSTPLQTATTTTQPQQVKLGQFPIAAAPSTVQQHQQTNIIAPKKDGGGGGGITLNSVGEQMTLIKTGPASADVVSDDSRQNATPDSSTNDCQLGLNLNPTNSITISLPSLGSNHITNSNTINISSLNKKVSVKSRAVSSSSGNGPPKRTQKQILPKIDSTTSVENS